MRANLLWAALCLALILPLLVKAADRDGGMDPPESSRMVPIGTVTGILRSAEGSQNTITIGVTLRQVQPKPQAAYDLLRQQRRLLTYQRQLLTSPPSRRPQILRQIVKTLRQGQGNHVQVITRSQNVQFRPTEDLKVRVMSPPPAYDEKGNPRKYTRRELRELKGDRKLPGYAADLNALRSGQLVTVFVVLPAKGKPNPDDLTEGQPWINLIVILGEPG